MVWLTFRLALDLFDLRIATLSACLIAIAPLHITYSQLARAYVPGSLAALFSLYFFARILFQRAAEVSLGWTRGSDSRRPLDLLSYTVAAGFLSERLRWAAVVSASPVKVHARDVVSESGRGDHPHPPLSVLCF